MISNLGRIKILINQPLKSKRISFKTKGVKTTSTVRKLVSKYFPNIKKTEIWKQLKERRDYYLSNFGHVKKICEKIINETRIKCKDGGHKHASVLVAKYFPAPDLENETWVEIPGFSQYQASTQARIRNKRTRRFLKPYKKGKYLFVKLQKDNSTKRKSYRFHRLMANLFLETVSDKTLVNHLDGNKENPKIENLEYTDHSGNRNHAIKTGLYNLVDKLINYIVKQNKLSQHIKVSKMQQRVLTFLEVLLL